MQRHIDMDKVRQSADHTNFMIRVAEVANETGEDQATVWERMMREYQESRTGE